MANAKQELQKALNSKAAILCAEISTENGYGEEDTYYRLKTGYNTDSLATFFESLNFNYDDGYGGQNLFGIVWLVDGTWLDRGEYDGSEWWIHQACPQIPEELK